MEKVLGTHLLIDEKEKDQEVFKSILANEIGNLILEREINICW